MRTYLLAAMLAAFSCSTTAQAQSQEPAKKEGFWAKVKRITAEEAAGVVTVNGKPVGGEKRIQNSDGSKAKLIADTPLLGIFSEDSAINADYPHVAITITDYSDRIVGRGMNPTSEIDRNDCLFFNATLWRSAKKSEQFDGLSYCASDGINGFMKGSFNGMVVQGFSTNANTGQRRTSGPLSPAMIYPGGSADHRLLDGPGYALLGNVLMAMGFDFTYGGNTGRAWVVSTSNIPGT